MRDIEMSEIAPEGKPVNPGMIDTLSKHDTTF